MTCFRAGQTLLRFCHKRVEITDTSDVIYAKSCYYSFRPDDVCLFLLLKYGVYQKYVIFCHHVNRILKVCELNKLKTKQSYLPVCHVVLMSTCLFLLG